MKTKLTQDIIKTWLNYDPDTGIFTRKINSVNNKMKAGDIAGCLFKNGYVNIVVAGERIGAHRLAWLYVCGEFPSTNIDHINRNRSDNRIVNLRLANQHQNMQNAGMFKHNTSGTKGVAWRKDKQKWNAQIMHNKKHLHIGYYNNFDDAKLAREIAEIFCWQTTHPLVMRGIRYQN
jgi:hypothetical protein